MFGIDQQVQQTADAYRGKPQMLQQKYAQNQQLIDLLALQKLKSDKEEASRQMALSMQGNPPTIADQRESQVLDMTKKEVIDEQAGVMQNKMKQMQDAQKKVLQAAGAPPMPGQAAPQPQQPPSAGLAGLAAPNIQGMAGGGIVAFRTGDTVEGDAGEAEARRYMEEQRQRHRQPQAQQQAAPRGGMQAGLDALLAIRPEEIYEQRRIAAARDTNFTPEERAAKERQIQERSAADREAAFINGLLGMAGRSSNAGAIAAGGAAAQNTRNQALAARQKAEGQLIDIGPASRAAGLKAGETAYGHAMPGLVSGVRSGVDLAQLGESSANRAEAALTRQQRQEALDLAKQSELEEKIRNNVNRNIKDDRYIQGWIKQLEMLPPSDPSYSALNKAIFERENQIRVEAGLPPRAAPQAVADTTPPKPPGVFDRLFGAGTPTAPKVVPFSSLKP